MDKDEDRCVEGVFVEAKGTIGADEYVPARCITISEECPTTCANWDVCVDEADMSVCDTPNWVTQYIGLICILSVWIAAMILIIVCCCCGKKKVDDDDNFTRVIDSV